MKLAPIDTAAWLKLVPPTSRLAPTVASAIILSLLVFMGSSLLVFIGLWLVTLLHTRGFSLTNLPNLPVQKGSHVSTSNGVFLVITFNFPDCTSHIVPLDFLHLLKKGRPCQQENQL
jgi:hypothetical protein